MRIVARLLLVLLLLLGLLRAGLFASYAILAIRSQVDCYHLEAKMVHLAWRAQAGVRLYPEWRDYPHVANFFAPLYFVLVGRIGRAGSASLEGLYLIGRLATVASVLATTLMLGGIVWRRYGTSAGLLGALLSLGVGPLYGFGVMVRPDAMADLLGLAGFFLAMGRRPVALGSGGALLLLAILTKQTSAAYLLAASLALAFQGRRRAAAVLVAACLGALVAVVLAVDGWIEPNFGPSLMNEGRTPWDPASWRGTASRLIASDSAWLVLAASGLVLWNTGGRRDVPATVLALVLLSLTFTTIAKLGSDLNYALGLRAVGSLGAGALWQAAWSPPSPVQARRSGPSALAWATALTVFAFLPSLIYAWSQVRTISMAAAYLRSPAGEDYLKNQRLLFSVAKDPSRRVLTDSGPLDIRQLERTAFADPWLFRMLVETGQIDPAKMRGWIETRAYNRIATTMDLMSPEYDTYPFGLPMELVERIRPRYRLLGSVDRLFLYVPLEAENRRGPEVESTRGPRASAIPARPADPRADGE
jgi:hypothetical protein